MKRDKTLKRYILLIWTLVMLATTAGAQVVHVTGTVSREMRGVDGKSERVPLSVHNTTVSRLWGRESTQR